MENRSEFRNHLETIPHPLCKSNFIGLVPLRYVFLTAKGKLTRIGFATSAGLEGILIGLAQELKLAITPSIASRHFSRPLFLQLACGCRGAVWEMTPHECQVILRLGIDVTGSFRKLDGAQDKELRRI